MSATSFHSSASRLDENQQRKLSKQAAKPFGARGSSRDSRNSRVPTSQSKMDRDTRAALVARSQKEVDDMLAEFNQSESAASSRGFDEANESKKNIMQML